MASNVKGRVVLEQLLHQRLEVKDSATIRYETREGDGSPNIPSAHR